MKGGNKMSKKKDKKSGNEKILARLVFITAVLNLIQAIVDLIKELK